MIILPMLLLIRILANAILRFHITGPGSRLNLRSNKINQSIMSDTANHASTRRQARTDGGGGGEKESSVPELCNLESVCGQACIYRVSLPP